MVGAVAGLHVVVLVLQAVTAGTYGHVSANRRKDATMKLGKALFGIGGLPVSDSKKVRDLVTI